MSSPSAPETTTTIHESNTQPWEGQQQYLLDVFKKAQDNYLTARGDTLPDQMTARIDPNTTAAQQFVTGSAVPGQVDLTQSAARANQFALGDVLDVENNEYLQGAINSATRPIVDNLLQRALPAIRSDAVLSGNLGSTRQGVAEGNAIDAATRNIGDVASNLSFAGYQRGLDTFDKGLALAPQTASSLTIPAVSQDAVGQQLRAYEQELLNEQLLRTDFEQNKGDVALSRYASLVGGAYGGESSGQTTAPGQRASPYAPFGMAMSGAGLGFQMGGPVGAGIGAGAGLIMSLLG